MIFLRISCRNFNDKRVVPYFSNLFQFAKKRNEKKFLVKFYRINLTQLKLDPWIKQINRFLVKLSQDVPRHQTIQRLYHF